MSKKAASTAKEMFDIDVFTGELDQCPFEKNSFDFINMGHVIEHFPDPIAALKFVGSLLKPSGVVYIETPNILGTVNARELSVWYPTETPRHLFLFSPETLADLIQRSGLFVDEITCTYTDFAEWEALYDFEESLGRLSPNREKLRSEFKKRILFKRLRNWLSYKLDSSRGEIIRCWVSK
jgi:SAM-dependent methyltransferase